MPNVKDKKSKVTIESNDQTVRTTLSPLTMNEHDKAYSRTLRRDLEIGVGMHGRSTEDYGGLVPANPFVSQAQQGYLHAHPEILGPKKLAEFDAATKGKHNLPKHVKSR
jgi:hypothetical protein